VDFALIPLCSSMPKADYRYKVDVALITDYSPNPVRFPQTKGTSMIEAPMCIKKDPGFDILILAE